jgi:methyltransferase (TIGR00027 family)
MQEAEPSRTAIMTSLIRALHSRGDPLRILDDPWGDRLMPEAVIQAMYERAVTNGLHVAGDEPHQAVVDRLVRASSGYASVITRARYTEDALHAAMERGVRQYVLIGAGFDSYALRHGSEHSDLRIFELDHPATQSFKLGRLQALSIAAPGNVHFSATDLTKESLQGALSRSVFDPREPAFFAWLGVTMYLSREVNLATLAAIANGAAAGSEIVFDYFEQSLFDMNGSPRSLEFAAMRTRVAEMGEAFMSGFEPAALPGVLAELGLKLEEDLTIPDLVARYDPYGVNNFVSGARAHVSRASLPR